MAGLEREPFSSAYSLAEALDVSPATVLSCLHNSLGVTNFHLRWVPHQLTDNLRQMRVAKCGELVRALEAVQRAFFATLSQAMRAGLTSNTSTPHNSQFLAMKYFKWWTRLLAPLSLCLLPFGASTASTCYHHADLMHNPSYSILWCPWFRQFSHKGGLGMLLDSMFFSRTAMFTSQK
jgi:hypothetical protein